MVFSTIIIIILLSHQSGVGAVPLRFFFFERGEDCPHSLDTHLIVVSFSETLITIRVGWTYYQWVTRLMLKLGSRDVLETWANWKSGSHGIEWNPTLKSGHLVESGHSECNRNTSPLKSGHPSNQDALSRGIQWSPILKSGHLVESGRSKCNRNTSPLKSGHPSNQDTPSRSPKVSALGGFHCTEVFLSMESPDREVPLIHIVYYS